MHWSLWISNSGLPENYIGQYLRAMISGSFNGTGKILIQYPDGSGDSWIVDADKIAFGKIRSMLNRLNISIPADKQPRVVARKRVHDPSGVVLSEKLTSIA